MPRALALIHGFLGGPASWDEVAARLPGQVCQRITLPGHGLPPARWAATRFDALVEEIAASTRGLGDGIVLAGYSMGARVALHLALRFPARVGATLLLGPDPGLEERAARDERLRWEADLARALREEGMARFVERWEALPLFQSQRELNAEVQALQRRRRLEHDPLALADALGVLGLGSMPSAWPKLAALRAPPMRVLAGSRDRKFAELGRRMASSSPAVSFDEVPGAGHNLLLEAPERVARELGDLLGC